MCSMLWAAMFNSLGCCALNAVKYCVRNAMGCCVNNAVSCCVVCLMLWAFVRMFNILGCCVFSTVRCFAMLGPPSLHVPHYAGAVGPSDRLHMFLSKARV